MCSWSASGSGAGRLAVVRVSTEVAFGRRDLSVVVKKPTTIVGSQKYPSAAGPRDVFHVYYTILHYTILHYTIIYYDTI